MVTIAEDGFKNILFGLVLFVGFAWLILSVAIDFGGEYDRDSQEIGNGSLSIVEFKETAENIQGDAEQYRTRFESGKVDDVDDASGIFSVLTDVISMIVIPFQLLGDILVQIFQVPILIISLILGLLSIGLILAIWRVLRIGS